MVAGSKTVEGRPATGWAATVQPNDFVRFNVGRGGPHLCVRVLRVRPFATFSEMLDVCGVAACLPGFVGDRGAAVRLYQSFGSSAGSYADLERSVGVVAIDVAPLAMPPHDDGTEVQ